MPVYLSCYGVYLLLWICATPPIVIMLLVRCVFVLLIYGPSLRAGRGIAPCSNVWSWVCLAMVETMSVTHPLVFLVDFVVPL
jgi:hypothetical protein